MLSPLSEIIAKKGGEIHAAAPETSVADAVRRMKERYMGSLLVTVEDRLVGIFTERDLLVRVVDGKLDPESTPLSAVMTPNPVCISAFATVENAMHVMTEKRIRHLPVLENDVLAGMVSIGDLARWLCRSPKGQLEDLIRVVGHVPAR